SEGVGDWLRRLQRESLKRQKYEHAALYEIQRWGGRAGRALFDSIVVFENYPVDEALRARSRGGMKIEQVEVQDPTHYDLTLDASCGERLRLKFGYSRGSFGERSIEALKSH